MLKILSWVVRLDAGNYRFFTTCAKPGFLSSLSLRDDGLTKTVLPCFGDDPILYGFRSACFLVRELRRTGYNVSAVPYAILMLKDAAKAFLRRRAAKAAARAKWRK